MDVLLAGLPQAAMAFDLSGAWRVLTIEVRLALLAKAARGTA
jgi:hypothetical protein